MEFLFCYLIVLSPNLIFAPLSTAAEQESAPQPSGQGPTPTACVEVNELLERQDDTTRITITQTFPRTLSTRTATVTLHGGIPTEPPPRSSEGVSNQQLGAIIGGEDFLDDKDPPPPPDSGPPRPPPTYSRPPSAPVLPAPFNGLHGEKKTVKFPDVLEEPIPELPTESDLPSTGHTKGNKKSTLIPPSPRQDQHSNGGVRPTSPEFQDEDHPKITEKPAEHTPKFKVANEANGQTSSPVESPSGMKSPVTGSRSGVPSPEIINVDQEPPLEELNEPVTKSDDAEKVNVQPSTPAGHQSGSNVSHSGAHPMTKSPIVIEVNPELPIHQESGSVSHTSKHSKPRAPNAFKSFSEGKPRSRRSGFSVASHTQTAPAAYSSYSHFRPPPALPTTTYRRAPPLPSDGYYYGRDHIPHYPPPPPSSHGIEVIATEHAELPQAKPVRAAGREGRRKNKSKTEPPIKIKALRYFAGREGEKDNRKRSPSRRRPSQKDG
ncbi:hypothetical protein LY76DRAFT_635082 [Colletotrichum caudatum]|nr:hypothetical protein LY76DRAFT_635082 [Colletotrichum caudatum]